MVRLLQEAINANLAIKELGAHITVVACINDTTGTLMSTAFRNPDCRIGVIIGTGTNAAYLEKMGRIPKASEKLKNDNCLHNMVVNTEWGAFGENGDLDFIRTPFDRMVDNFSLHPGVHIFEKMTSGGYLGEIVRWYILTLTYVEQALFDGVVPIVMWDRDVINAKFLSLVESDAFQGPYDQTRKALAELEVKNATDRDCINVKKICAAVSTRSAELVAAATVTLLKRIAQERVIIGIDGTLFKKHPKYNEVLRDKIVDLLPHNLMFDLIASQDGSGIGAALVAVVATNN